MNGNIKMLVALMVIVTMTVPAMADVPTKSFASGSVLASGEDIRVSVSAGTSILEGMGAVVANAGGRAESGLILANANSGVSALTWTVADIEDGVEHTSGEIKARANINAAGDDVNVGAGAGSCVFCDSKLPALSAQVEAGSSASEGFVDAHTGTDLSGSTLEDDEELTGINIHTNLFGIASSNGIPTSFTRVNVDMIVPIYG